MKKILLIVGVVSIVVCVLALLCAQYFLHIHNGTFDAPSAVYIRFQQMRNNCLLIGIIFAAIGIISMIVRGII